MLPGVGGEGLSVRARRLLLEGDTESRYAGRSAGNVGNALTMALAAAASQPGPQQRTSYQRYLEWRAERAARRYQSNRPRLRLVPEDVVDPHTGEVDPRWTGWDVSDPLRPVWTGDRTLAPPGEPVAGVCA
ncbi:hypothetical protein CTZ27_29750 [Streptomyces griseocarneus]|nr:hypothetical protein CTZ27_29750 [Streptomyces griseocarneus]